MPRPTSMGYSSMLQYLAIQRCDKDRLNNLTFKAAALDKSYDFDYIDKFYDLNCGEFTDTPNIEANEQKSKEIFLKEFIN